MLEQLISSFLVLYMLVTLTAKMSELCQTSLSLLKA